MNKVLGWYFIVVGIGIVALWLMLIVSDQVPELQTEPAAITFHIIVECLMAVAAITAGTLTLKNHKWSVEALLFASGMILYSVINSSGYYAESGEYAMIVLFSLLLVLTGGGCLYALHARNQKRGA